jgi:hypothetical protein
VSDQSRDRELEALYEGLKAEDEKQAPDFARMMAKAHAQAGETAASRADRPAGSGGLFARPRLAWAGGAVAAAAAAVLMLMIPRGPDAHFEEVVRAFSTDPAAGQWTSPTDGLLQVPGVELLSSVPRIGGLGVALPPDDRPSSQL